MVGCKRCERPCMPLQISALSQAATTSNLYADSTCNSNLCLSVIYSPSEQTMNMTMSANGGGTPMGWYAVGTGSKMDKSNMMIGWVNADGTVTMSQRTANNHNDPTTTVSAKAASLETKHSFSNSTGTVWKWTFPMSSSDSTPTSSTPFIWAVNKNDNPTTSVSAHLKQHKNFGTFFLDLTKAYDASSSGSSSGSGSGSSSGNSNGVLTPSSASSDESTRTLNMSNNLIIAHMVFMILAWFLLVPSAILVGRFGRTLFTWFPVHRNIQIAAFVSVLIAFVIIVIEVAKGGGGHFDNTHGRAGLAIFIVMILQMALGQVGHVTKRFNPSRVVHVVIGLGVTVAAIWNSTEGLSLWEWGAPNWARWVLWAWAALMAVIYLAGLALLPKDLREWRANRDAQGEKTPYSLPQDSGTYLAGSGDAPMSAQHAAFTHGTQYADGPQHPGWGAPPLRAEASHSPTDYTKPQQHRF
ncbi:CBD9-like protein [Testicularia cyperi]|uniref:CBD9-like protein n=1 Tax=Testicularia cyperi TaxID=1882483 RepID=A0A317XKS4_9BASI|nr:CBD9-like protein [Testicularia cyperi]